MTKVGFAFVKNTRWYAVAGALIRWFERLTTGLDASHCQVIVYDGDNELIIESVWPKSRITGQTNHYTVVEQYNFEVDKSVEDILNFARQHIEGKPYSFLQNGWIGLTGLLMAWLKIQVWQIENVDVNGRYRQNCSEAQVMMAQYCLGVHPTEGLDDYSVGEARDLIKSVFELREVTK